MNDENRPASNDKMLERLLQASGRGPMAGAQARARVYSAVHATWISEQQRAKPVGATKVWRRFAMAASIAAVAVTVYLLQSTPPQLELRFASVSKLEGELNIADGNAGAEHGADTAVVHVGDTLTTAANGRAALRLDSGEILRLHSGTELMLTALDQVRLRNGTVYFDSGDGGDSGLSIQTAFGSVRHVGTQYEASVGNTDLRIRVREGSVAFSDAAREFSASAGDELRISRTGTPIRTEIAPDDPAWQWTEELALLDPASEHRLGEVLRWIARETGRTLRFADQATEQRAEDVIVRGLGGLTPSEALTVLTETTAFAVRASGSELIVE